MRICRERLNEKAHHGDIRGGGNEPLRYGRSVPRRAVDVEFLEPAILEPVQVKDRHVAATAMAVQAMRSSRLTSQILQRSICGNTCRSKSPPDDFVMESLMRRPAPESFRGPNFERP